MESFGLHNKEFKKMSEFIFVHITHTKLYNNTRNIPNLIINPEINSQEVMEIIEIRTND